MTKDQNISKMNLSYESNDNYDKYQYRQDLYHEYPELLDFLYIQVGNRQFIISKSYFYIAALSLDVIIGLTGTIAALLLLNHLINKIYNYFINKSIKNQKKKLEPQDEKESEILPASKSCVFSLQGGAVLDYENDLSWLD